MVQFGQTLEEQKRPEWAAGYVGYKALKKLLKGMDEAGTTREFSELSVYKAFSIASASNLLRPEAPRESDFFGAIDVEILKVNKFADGLRKQLVDQFQALLREHKIWAKEQDPAKAVALRSELNECSEALQRFEDFINLNYIAFSKILKKHDKLSSCPCRAPYLLRIQRETFARHSLTELIKGISDLGAKLAAPADAPADAAPGGTFDALQKGGTTFIRSTRKYWVSTENVLKVKTFLLRHLPIYKFTDGATDSDLVSSIYFDSPSRELYEGRLKKFDGAIALRIRWYGHTPADEDTVFVERKVHREDWFNEGRASTKERFPLRADEVMPLLSGGLSDLELRTRLVERKFSGSVDDALELAAEVRRVANEQALRPSIRTHYMRTAFQKKGDATVRISLDTDLCMSTELCQQDEWKRSGPLTSLAQLTHFPLAVLELKLQLASDGVSTPEPPEWIAELLESGCLIDAPKFSKFVHGTAMLYREPPSGRVIDGFPPVCELPYWWADDVRVLWRNSSADDLLLKGVKHKHVASLEPGSSRHGAGELVVHNPLQRLFEWLITCGNPPHLRVPVTTRTLADFSP